jgi:hypothetical protein
LASTFKASERLFDQLKIAFAIERRRRDDEKLIVFDSHLAAAIKNNSKEDKIESKSISIHLFQFTE